MRPGRLAARRARQTESTERSSNMTVILIFRCRLQLPFTCIPSALVCEFCTNDEGLWDVRALLGFRVAYIMVQFESPAAPQNDPPPSSHLKKHRLRIVIHFSTSPFVSSKCEYSLLREQLHLCEFKIAVSADCRVRCVATDLPSTPPSQRDSHPIMLNHDTVSNEPLALNTGRTSARRSASLLAWPAAAKARSG